jgi:hypothetical protein
MILSLDAWFILTGIPKLPHEFTDCTTGAFGFKAKE